MASNIAPTPIILCGQTEQIGSAVIAGIKPEFDAVHFIKSVEAAVTEIPTILQGEKPATSSSNIGSGNISADNRPLVVILGGGFSDTFDQVHAGVEAAFGSSSAGVAWLRHDGTKPAPPLGPEYGKAMIQRVRERMTELKQEGKLGTGKSEVYWY